MEVEAAAAALSLTKKLSRQQCVLTAANEKKKNVTLYVNLKLCLQYFSEYSFGLSFLTILFAFNKERLQVFRVMCHGLLITED